MSKVPVATINKSEKFESRDWFCCVQHRLKSVHSGRSDSTARHGKLSSRLECLASTFTRVNKPDDRRVVLYHKENCQRCLPFIWS
jgi:hypothetical protein